MHVAIHIVVTYLRICMYPYVVSSHFFTRCPSRHGPSIMIKLPVVCLASTLLMISIYLTIILASSQGLFVSWRVRNLQATCMYLTHKFYLVAKPYHISIYICLISCNLHTIGSKFRTHKLHVITWLTILM